MDLTEDPKEIGRLAASEDWAVEALEGEIDSLLRVVPLTSAVVWVVRDEALVARAIRGPAPPRSQIPFADAPALREAIEAPSAHVHPAGSPEGDLLGGAIAPSGACVLVPLRASGQPIGALTAARAEPFDPAALSVIEIYARLLAFALSNAAHFAALLRLRSDGEERVSLLEAELGGGESDGVLETSQSPAVLEVAWKAQKVAPTDTPVLILGETGTGKEWLARAVHRWSERAEHPFVKINCAAMPAGLLESELFGHVKGAFTGATRDRPGRFQIAHGGTLLLDEIGELPLELQSKLLRVLQEGTFFPVGSDRQVAVDVRILAATHVDLERAIAEKTFREDLYYRLSVFPLKLPPLRERLEDLPRLCEVLLAAQTSRTGRGGMRLLPEGLAVLRAYDWPGNLRELANVLERATILARGKDLGPEVLDLPGRPKPAVPPSSPPAEPTLDVLTLDEAQRLHIQRVLALTGGRIYGAQGAARLLGMKPSTLQSRMKKLGIARAAHPEA